MSEICGGEYGQHDDETHRMFAPNEHRPIPSWITEVALMYQRSPRPGWVDLARDINEAHNAHCEAAVNALEDQ